MRECKQSFKRIYFSNELKKGNKIRDRKVSRGNVFYYVNDGYNVTLPVSIVWGTRRLDGDRIRKMPVSITVFDTVLSKHAWETRLCCYWWLGEAGVALMAQLLQQILLNASRRFWSLKSYHRSGHLVCLTFPFMKGKSAKEKRVCQFGCSNI